MDPISKAIFSYDYHRFVLQDLTAVPPPAVPPTKKFELYPKVKSEKTKKEKEREKKQKGP